MKFIIYCLAPLLTGCFNQQNKTYSAEPIKIDSSWKQKTINYVLAVSLPDSSKFEQTDYMKYNYGYGKLGSYGVTRYDTIVAYVTNETEFKNALKGFLAFQFTLPELIPRELSIRDTMIANSSGYFMTGYTTDTLEPYKYEFSYLTIANNNFYWFYAFQPSPKITNETIQFFQSIQFKPKYFKESEYQLPPTRIHKEANSATVRAYPN
jgi:hypothetical protein